MHGNSSFGLLLTFLLPKKNKIEKNAVMRMEILLDRPQQFNPFLQSSMLYKRSNFSGSLNKISKKKPKTLNPPTLQHDSLFGLIIKIVRFFLGKESISYYIIIIIIYLDPYKIHRFLIFFFVNNNGTTHKRRRKMK